MEKPGKPNIAIIIPGGLGTGKDNIGVPVMQEIMQRLGLRFDITVFSFFKVNPDYIPQNFRIISLDAASSLSKILKLYFAFKREHRRNNFSIIHAFWASPSGICAVWLARIFRLKSVISVLGGDAVALPKINYGLMRKSLLRRMIIHALDHSDEVIVLTQYLLDHLKKYSLRRKEVKIIPWGIDTARFQFLPKPFGDVLRFTNIANLSPVKDQTTLIRCFKEIHEQMPNSELLIIGEGSEEQKLLTLISELKLTASVEIKKPVPYSELPFYYHRSDMMLHTSLSEGQSEVVTEAMCSGVIVCGTRVGLISDLPHCVVAVEPGDFHALSAAVITLLSDIKRGDALRHAAHWWADEHTLDWTVKKMSEVYDSLLQ